MILSYFALICVLGGAGLTVTALALRPRRVLHWAVAASGLCYAAWASAFVVLFSQPPSENLAPAYFLAVAGMFLYPVALYWAWLCLAGTPPRRQVALVVPFVVFALFVVIQQTLDKTFTPDFRSFDWSGHILLRGAFWPWLVMVVYSAMQLVGYRELTKAIRHHPSVRLKKQMRFVLAQSLGGNGLYLAAAALANLLNWPSIAVLTIVYPLVLNFYLISRYRYLKLDFALVEREVISVMDEALILVDEDFNMVRHNLSARALFHLPEGCRSDVVGFDEPEKVRADWEAAKAGEERRNIPHTAGGLGLLVSFLPIRDDFGDLIGGALLVKKRDPVDFAAEALGLSDREKDVAVLVVHGFSNQEIADRQFISPATVKTHIYNIFKKAGVKSRLALMKKLLGPLI